MRTITSDLAVEGRPLAPVWSACVGAGRAYINLRADFQAQLRRAVGECGFRYVRFHGLFHDDMGVYREDADGRPMHNWQVVDALYDGLLEAGVRPFVEFGFCPKDLATETETVFWWKGHGAPPKDLGKWSALVEALVRHWAARYGLDEIRRWYYEVWNEPNLQPFFRGTRSQYFELYRATATAVKAVDRRLRVGGPATANFVPDDRYAGDAEDPSAAADVRDNPEAHAWRGVWIREFLDFCDREGLAVDFVSTHPYPTDLSLDEKGESRGVSRYRDAVLDDLRWLREAIAASRFPNAELHLTEWSTSPSCRDHLHDFPPAACYVARSYLKAAALCNSLSYWTLSDVFEENGPAPSVWHGGFGLVNHQGLRKPTYWTFVFLNRLGETLVAQGEGYAVTRRAGGGLAALLYHYPPEVPATPTLADTAEKARAVTETGAPLAVRLEIENVPPGRPVAVRTVDATAGFARGVWEAVGSPEPPTREKLALIEETSQPGLVMARTGEDGRLALDLELRPWAVALVETV